MADLQQIIDEQFNSEDTPRGVITVQNASGSATLPKGCRLALIGGSGVTISNEDQNEINLSDVSDITLSGLKNCTVKMDDCSSIKTLEGEGLKVNCGGADIENIELTASEVNLADCEIKSASFTQCNLSSIKNQFDDLEILSGQAYLDDNQLKQLSMSQGAHTTLVKGSVESTVDLEESQVVLQDTEVQGEFIGKDSQAMLIKGTFDKITFEGKSVVVLNRASVQGQVELSEGQFQITKASIEGKVTVDSGNASFVNSSIEGDLKATDSQLIATDTSIEGDLDLSKTSARIVKCSIEGDLKFSDGALDSEENTIEGDIDGTGGKVVSVRDQCSGDVSISSVEGPNILRSLQSKDLDIDSDGGASLLLDDVQAQDVTLNGFHSVNSVNLQAQEVTADTIGQLLFDDSNTCTKLTLTDVLSAIISSQAQVEASNCSVVDNDSMFTSLEDCQINATNSQITGADGSVVSLNGGSIQGDDCVVINNGGSVQLIGGTVITNGGSVLNPQGLTVGKDFSVAGSGGSVCYDGDLTIQATIGNVIINSLVGNITATAPTGNFLANAGLNASVLAGVDAFITGGVNINMNAGGDINGNAIGAVAFTAAGDAQLVSSGNTMIVGATTSVTATGIASIAAPSIQIAGFVDFQ